MLSWSGFRGSFSWTRRVGGFVFFFGTRFGLDFFAVAVARCVRVVFERDGATGGFERFENLLASPEFEVPVVFDFINNFPFYWCIGYSFFREFLKTPDVVTFHFDSGSAHSAFCLSPLLRKGQVWS